MPTLRESLRNLPDAVFADLLESEDAYRLVVDAAGVAPETLDASAERGRLRVSARREKAVPGEFRYRAEERALFVDFEVPLPPDAAARVGSTDVDRGVVTVTVPKRGRESGVAVPVTSDAEEEPIIGEQSEAGEPAADDDDDDTENEGGPTGSPDARE